MFARAFFRSSPRVLPRAISRTLPKAPNHTYRQPTSFTLPRYGSNYSPRGPQRIVHYRYDPQNARNAKPLLTAEQVAGTLRSPRSKWILILSSGSALVFYFSNLETVPVSGRRRFNCYSDESVEAQGSLMYSKIMSDAENAILPSWDPRTKQVERVMRRLIPASGLEDVNWEVHVIQSNGRFL